MKKIAILSDIHGNLAALEQVVADIQRRGVDLVVNLGDLISGPLWPKETLDYLRTQDWIQIRGNHERQILTQNPEQLGVSDLFARRCLDVEDLKWLHSLPARAEIGTEIVLVHGSPSDDKQYLLEAISNGHSCLASLDEIKARIGDETAPIILCGHTHISRIVAVSDNQLVVNPGSVGLPAYDDIEPEPHVMEAGSPHARYAVLEKNAERWNTELIAISYDHNRAVDRARANNREDWVIGLQTGFMKLK
ncbi:MAG: metallophosphoesterase family protein [Anaerolineales bacterium]|nr:metallophosphoesterase family protein [Chloroflexota bacterium]MBL6980382.1 metallophosphoesterase family protein [Anaerolineales bacterium]